MADPFTATENVLYDVHDDDLNLLRTGGVVGTSPTNTAVSIGNTSTLVLAANSGRRYAIFSNDSDEPIYLSLGAAAVLNTSLLLNDYGGLFEINSNNLFTGEVYAICSSGGKNLCVIEG